ncbi:MAG: hypothetical protein ACTIMT_09010 [Marinomonadaceae bacterium]
MLVDNIDKLIALKMALLERIKARETIKTYDAFAQVNLSDIRVTDNADFIYDHPYITPVTIAPDLPFNITYCEQGVLFINGRQADTSNKRITFSILYDNIRFNVSARLVTTKSGWE